MVRLYALAVDPVYVAAFSTVLVVVRVVTHVTTLGSSHASEVVAVRDLARVTV